jgi:hypothetical protein
LTALTALTAATTLAALAATLFPSLVAAISFTAFATAARFGLPCTFVILFFSLCHNSSVFLKSQATSSNAR